MNDKPFSILTLDKDFNVCSEQEFDPKVFSPFYFIPCEAGLLISNRKQVSDTSNKLDFTLFKINETE